MWMVLTNAWKMWHLTEMVRARITFDYDDNISYTS